MPQSPASSSLASFRDFAVPMAAVATFLASTAAAKAEEATGAASTPASTAPAAAPEKPVLGPPPADFGLKYSFYDDCQKVK